MSLSPAVLDAMLGAGCTAEQIVAAVKAEGAEDEAKKAVKRANDAARQRKHRGKNGESRNVTVTPRDNGVTSVTPPPNEEIISIPPPDTPVISNEMTAPPIELKPEHVVEAWNARAPTLGLRAVRKFTSQRRQRLATRIRQNSIEDFTEAIAAIERSPFLRGENDRGWRADFDWMLEPKNFTKLIEGNYDR